MPLRRQILRDGFQPFLDDRHFHHRIFMDLGQRPPFAMLFPWLSMRYGFEADRAIDNAADFLVKFQWLAPGFGHQARVRGHSVNDRPNPTLP